MDTDFVFPATLCSVIFTGSPTLRPGANLTATSLLFDADSEEELHVGKGVDRFVELFRRINVRSSDSEYKGVQRDQDSCLCGPYCSSGGSPRSRARAGESD